MNKNKLTTTILVVVLCVIMATLLVACNTNTEVFDTSLGARLFRQTSTTKFLGEVKRQTPEIKDGGVSSYPSYTNTVKDATIKAEIAAENTEFFRYDKIDADGNLYIADKDEKGNITGYTAKGEKLFKHTAADGIYQEAVPKDATAVIAKVHVRPSNLGNNLTELYIPAGEIVKVIIDDNLVAKGGLVVNIGYGAQRGGSVDIPEGRDFSRFPKTRKTMTLKDNINYIGSPIGGSLYFHSEQLMNKDANIQYDVTVVGAVQSPQYYFGSTSDEDWEKSKNAAGVFFHMEIRAGIRLTMPASFIREKSAEEMRLLGQFYENAATLSNKLYQGGWYVNHPVDCMFDSYVAAGAAVAFVGADFCMNPTDWAAGAVDYYSITNNGSWGVLHEFNHHHQGWGAGAGGEVTNNVANFLTYALYTNVGAYKKVGASLDGWNWVADAYQSLVKTRKSYDNRQLNRELNMYVDLGHAFGEEFMYKLAAKTRIMRVDNVEDDAYNMNQFYQQASIISGYDMTYYLQTINNFVLSQDVIDAVKALNLPMYVPIASPYQTAIAMNGSDYIELGKPYYVAMGSTEKIDFATLVDMPNVNISNIEVIHTKTSGKLELIAGNAYNYTPDMNSKSMDEITLEIERQFTDGTPIPKVRIQVKLAADLSFATGTLYENSGFASIDDVINANFDGLKVLDTISNNRAAISTQIGNAIGVISGKIQLPTGAYTIIIKGDDQVKLVLGEGNNEVIAHLGAAAGYDYLNKNTIININSDGSAIPFKLYMLNTGGRGSANIGYVQSYNADGTAKIIDIPTKYLRNINYNNGDYLKNNFAAVVGNNGEYYATAKQEDMGSDANVTVSPDPYGNHLPKYAVDGNRQTFFHTKTGLDFPQGMVIDYGRAVKFNNINILPRSDSNGAGRIKMYEIWAGNTPTELSKIAEGEGLNSYDGFDAPTPITTARYVKIVVISVFSENYFAISEVIPSLALKSNNIILSNSKHINLTGDWQRKSYGSSLNGEVLYTNKGSANIRFKGTAFVVVGNKDYNLGSAKIYVDGKIYGEIDCYSDKAEYDKPLIIALGLSDTYHDIEIKTNGDKAINFNYIMLDVDGDVVRCGLPFAAIIIIIVIAALITLSVLIIIIAIIVGHKRKKRLKVKLATVEKLQDVVIVEHSKSDSTARQKENSTMKPIIVREPPKAIVSPMAAVIDAPMKPIKTIAKTVPKVTEVELAKAEKPKVVPTVKTEQSAVAPKTVKPKIDKPEVASAKAVPAVKTEQTAVAPKTTKTTKTKIDKPEVVATKAVPTVKTEQTAVAPKTVKAKTDKPEIATTKAVPTVVREMPKPILRTVTKPASKPKAISKDVDNSQQQSTSTTKGKGGKS